MAPSFKNNNFCFEKTINSIITESLLINLTRSPRKKDLTDYYPPPRKLPPFEPASPLNVRCPPLGVWRIFSGTTQCLETYHMVCDGSDQKGGASLFCYYLIVLT